MSVTVVKVVTQPRRLQGRITVQRRLHCQITAKKTVVKVK